MIEDQKHPPPGAPNPEAEPIPGIIRGLADLPAQTILDVKSLAHLFSRCTKTIQRAVRRGELPPPQKVMGRHVWTAGVILEHFMRRQAAAAKQVDARQRRITSQNP